MVLHSLFSTSFSTFNSLPASSSQRASRLSWLFRLFQLFAALPQVCSAVACFFYRVFVFRIFAQLLPVFLRSVCVQNFRVVNIILGKVFSTRELATFFFLWSTFHDHHLLYHNPSYHSYHYQYLSTVTWSGYNPLWPGLGPSPSSSQPPSPWLSPSSVATMSKFHQPPMILMSSYIVIFYVPFTFASVQSKHIIFNLFAHRDFQLVCSVLQCHHLERTL